MKIYNCFGERIENAKIPENVKFFDEKGIPLWGRYVVNGDTHGFDITRLDENREYKRDIILPPGKRIVRYGAPGGRFSTDYGTPYEYLSLPYLIESMEYREYIIQKNFHVNYIVTQGYVASGFGKPGGGIQYMHPESITESINKKILKEDMSWLKQIMKK